MQSNVSNTRSGELEPGVNDLGPLAWVLDELRKSLEGASKALKRFVRDAETARGSDLAALDSSQLRIARQQLHQSVGALEMVGLPAPALVLRAMEAAVQRFVQHPEHCDTESAAKIERASFALTEYLQSVLSDKQISAVSLFPQYREIQELVRADRVHPADLWLREWRWLDPEFTNDVQPQEYGISARTLLDQSVLRLMKGQSPTSAQHLNQLSLGFAANQTIRQPRIFWKLAAGYFEALANDLLTSDLYVKRATSRVLLQYASLAKGETSVSERLAQDLLFFCAQAAPVTTGVFAATPALLAIHSVYGLDRHKPVDYELIQFGRFDPALMAQARKRIAAAKETWSALSAGDLNKFKVVSDQFSLITDSLIKLHAPSAPLAHALTRVVEGTARAQQPPRIELAMEVATSIMYLEAAFEDLDPSDPQLTARTLNLAERLDGVRSGGDPQPLESWMEELYSRVSDKQTMGSVVGELRISLSELEKSLDAFFRDPTDKVSLQSVPGQLSQMRGVLSVLGLEQAAHAVLRMRASVEEMLITEIDEERARAAGTFDQLGNNVGALSFLIDMLNYQPVLAKKLFVFDEAKGELKPLMGRTQRRESTGFADSSQMPYLAQEVATLVQDTSTGALSEDVTLKLTALAEQAALADQHALAQSAREASRAISANQPEAALIALAALNVPSAVSEPTSSPQTDSGNFEEDDLRGIFLEEAREVVSTGREAMAALAEEPTDENQLTVLRRAFHTLKGSARMVGLNEFGEAGWAFEQLLNSWLADQKPATNDFQLLAGQGLDCFESWIGDIAMRQDSAWLAVPFCVSADALRIEGRFVALAYAASNSDFAFELDAHPDNAFDLSDFDLELSAPQTDALPEAVEEPIDFSSLFDDVAEPLAATPLALEGLVALPVETLNIDGIDFNSLQHLTNEKSSLPDAETPEIYFDDALSTPLDADSSSAVDIDFSVEPALPEIAALFSSASQPLTVPSAAATVAEPEAFEREGDEQIKIIGSLRIGIPLYNVYLNEADEWSRRLVSEVGEWSLQPAERIADSTVGFAHSLAGSSATVGFHALSDIARAFEHALQQSQAYQRRGAAMHAKLFIDVAEDIRRLLHQFAAGFLKTPDEDLLSQLKNLDFVDSAPSLVNVAALSTDETAQLSALVSASIHDIKAPAVEEVKTIATLQPVGSKILTVAAMPHINVAEGVTTTQYVAKVLPTSSLTTQNSHDEIDATDAIDPDLFPIFEEEAAELMPQLGGALRQWSARPDNHSARAEVLRALHTLKGSARLAGALRLGEMAHLIESEVEYLGSEAPTAEDFEELLTRFDAMQLNFDRLRHPEAATTDGQADETIVPVGNVVPPAMQITQEISLVAGLTRNTTAAVKNAVPAPQAMVMKPLRQAASASVRVRSQLLDRMVNQAGEVMITRSRLEAELGQLRGSLSDMNGNLNRLRQHLRDIELQAETQMQSRLAQAKEAQAGFDPLEIDRFTRVQELTRMMAESVNDVATVQRTLQRTVEATEDDLIAQARQTRELQRDLLRTRMVEFEGISDRLYRVVRQASKDSGKQVRLDLLGGTIEMDRGMLDRLTPAFEHLLRNCVAHGIEDHGTRTAAGKDAVGLITVHLKHEGNDVSVDFSDDGAGLDLRRIRDKALAQGLVPAEQIMTDQQAADLIFTPGFTTATQVTELSGRGIGMDVVRSEVNSLGGRIETSTVSGQGTHFKLVLPLTTAVTQVVMIRSGNLSVGVPANLIETVRRVSGDDLKRAYSAGTFEVAGEALPFFWSGALLQSSRHSTEPATKTTPLVIFKSADQRIVLHVDEVLGNQEVVVKNLGPQLSRLPGLAGMSVLASGAVVLIYNPVALASIYGTQAREWGLGGMPQAGIGTGDVDLGRSTPQIPHMPQMPQIPLILVVDDSITVRRVTQRLLQREGYRVAMAADGLQALERLQEEVPSVVLSDIEMPRMDGFDLARNIRADVRLKGLPIIMITSRIAEKHREHAMELGVDHYLGKPYSEEELMSLVRHYCAVETVVAA